jgi:hypothetical protein
MDEFDKSNLTKLEEKHRRKIQSQIESCAYCQPYDEGEPVWIHGERTDLSDLLYDLNVPEKSWHKIISHLGCPNCGNESFDECSEVGVKTKFDKEIDKHMDEVNSLYGKEVKRLECFLEKYPFLAYSDKFAKRIYKEIKEKKLPIVKISGEFYRARKVESSEVLNKHKMYNPPIGKPNEGRFNHAGQSHLYLSNDKSTALKEVVADENSLLVWTQKFEILEEIDNVLDLSFDWFALTPSTSTLLLSLKVYNSIGRSDRNKELWKPDYYLTRYIMDCAKEQGYNGIKYNSTKDQYEFDVVLFYPDELKIKAIGNPCVEIFLNNEDKNEFQTNLLDI